MRSTSCYTAAATARRLAVLTATVTALLWLTTSAAWAQGTVAVLGFEHEGQAPPDGLVEFAREALEQDGRTWVMPSDESSARLTAGQFVGGADSGARAIVSELQSGIDAFFADDIDQAQELLDAAIARALNQPMLLTLDANLAEATKSALLTLPRALSARAAFDEADEALLLFASSFPMAQVSSRQHPPGIIEALARVRSEFTPLANRLWLRSVDSSSPCDVNIHGDEVALAQAAEREIPVAPKDHGIRLRCGEHEAGPYLVSMARSKQTLPVSQALLEALAPSEEGKPLALPQSFEQRRDLGVLLTTLLGVDAVVLVGAGGDGLLALRVTRDSAAVQATLEAAPSAEAARELVRALEVGEPQGAVGVDATGRGFIYAESPSYIVEYIVLGAGAATVIAGGVLLGLAASQGDVVRDCQSLATCRRATEQDNGDIYATNLFTGQLLLGLGSALVVAGGTSWLIRYLLADDSELDALATGDGPGLVAGPHGALATWRLSW